MKNKNKLLKNTKQNVPLTKAVFIRHLKRKEKQDN